MPAVAQELSLSETNGVETGLLVAGQTKLTKHEGIAIGFYELPDRRFPASEVLCMPPMLGDVEIIIGRNVLQWFVMEYDGPAGRVFLTYRHVEA